MRTVLGAVLVLSLGIAACTSSNEQGSGASAAAAATSDTSATDTSIVAAPPDSQRPGSQSGETTGSFGGTQSRTQSDARVEGIVLLDGVRTAHHPGFERVVFAFRNGIPGYVVEYASDAPTHCGSGAPAAVAGGAHLTVRLSPTDAHEFVGEDARSTIPSRDIRPNGEVLKQLLLTCDFEAVVTWVLGLDAKRPYRVFTLTDPARIVVDVESAP